MICAMSVFRRLSAPIARTSSCLGLAGLRSCVQAVPAAARGQHGRGSDRERLRKCVGLPGWKDGPDTRLFKAIGNVQEVRRDPGASRSDPHAVEDDAQSCPRDGQPRGCRTKELNHLAYGRRHCSAGPNMVPKRTSVPTVAAISCACPRHWLRSIPIRAGSRPKMRAGAQRHSLEVRVADLLAVVLAVRGVVGRQRGRLGFPLVADRDWGVVLIRLGRASSKGRSAGRSVAGSRGGRRRGTDCDGVGIELAASVAHLCGEAEGEPIVVCATRCIQGGSKMWAETAKARSWR